MISYKLHSEDWTEPIVIQSLTQIDRDFIFTKNNNSYCIDRFEVDLDDLDYINIYLENIREYDDF